MRLFIKKFRSVFMTLVVLVGVLPVYSMTALAEDSQFTVNIEVDSSLGWGEVALYGWDGIDIGAWPGTKLTGSDNKYTTNVTVSGETFNCIVNNNNNDGQTSDIEGIDATKGSCTIVIAADKSFTVTYPDGQQQEVETADIKVTVKLDSSIAWDSVFLHTWDTTSSNTTWPGSEMTAADGAYTLTIPVATTRETFCAIAHDNNGAQTVDVKDISTTSGDVVITLSGDVSDAEGDAGKFLATVTYETANNNNNNNNDNNNNNSNDNNNNTNPPKTGDNTAVFALLTALCLASVVVVTLKRSSLKSEN